MSAPSVQIIGANNVWIHTEEGTYCQSYSTIVALQRKDGSFTLAKAWDCSRTTAKHVSYFVGRPAAEIRKAIKAGEIEVVEVL